MYNSRKTIRHHIFLYPPWTKFRGYIEITLSVRLSVQIRLRPITFFLDWHWLTIFGTWVSPKRRCVAYIHDPDTTLSFDLNVKFIGFLTCFRVRSITFLKIDIGLPYLAHGCITIRLCVAYIHGPDLTFDLLVKFIGFCHVCMSIL